MDEVWIVLGPLLLGMALFVTGYVMGGADMRKSNGIDCERFGQFYDSKRTWECKDKP